MAYLEHDYGFEPGMIRRIRLNNFLTYKEVEMFAGPRHNLVLGPNGTGKSSLLCAIGLGLGGNPKILGRADGIGQFILHGESAAHIEIVLQDSEPDRVFLVKRSFDQSSKRASKWYTRTGHVSELEPGASESKNFAQSNEEKVREKVRGLGIDVNNLTCFMPQERVGEFSGINSQELLVNTLKVLENKANSEGTSPHVEHAALIQMEKEINSMSMEDSTIQRDLDRMKTELDILKRDVDRQVARKSLVEAADLHRKLLMWLQFDELRKQGKKLQEDLKALKKQQVEEREKLEPLEKQFHILDEKLTTLKSKKKKFENKKARLLEACNAEQSALSDLDTNMALTKDHLQSVDTERKRDERRVEEITNKIRALEQEIAAIDIPATEAALARANSEQQSIQSKISALSEQKDQTENVSRDLKDRADNVKHELAEISNSRKRTLQKIRNKYGTQRADACLRAEKMVAEMRKQHQFRGEVYGPVIAETTASNEVYAAAVEDYIGGNAPLNFVVGNKHDYDLINREIIHGKGLKIYLSMVDGSRQDRHSIDESSLQAFRNEADILVRGDQAFEAPGLVKKFLCSFLALDKMLIGTDQTEDRVDGFLKRHVERLGAVTVYTQPGGNQLRKHRGEWSKQGNCMVNSTQDCQPGSVLGTTSDGQEEGLQRQLEEIMAENDRATKKYQEISGEIRDLSQRRAALAMEVKRHRSLLAQPEAKRKKKKSFEWKRVELQRKVSKTADAARKELASTLQNMAHETCDRVRILQQRIKELAELHVPFLQSELMVFVVDRAREQQRKALESASRQVEQITKEVQRADKEFKEKKSAARKFKTKLATEAPITEVVTDENGNQVERDTPLRAKIKELEQNYNDDVDLVQEGLEEISEKLSAIQENEDVYEQYETLQAKYEERKLLSQQRDELQKSKEENLNLRIEKHRGYLEGLVTMTSSAFDEYMNELNFSKCSVELFAEGPVARWELHIKVRFREDVDLQTLSAHVHSGGERAVSTIMFLMALQHLVSSPFRIVDEINQGMDERNERLAMRRIIANTTGKAGKQYFLITPKLLEGLTYMDHEDVVVHIVYNGRKNVRSADWDISEFTAKRRRLVV